MNALLSKTFPNAPGFAQASYPGLAGKVVLNTGAASGIGEAMTHGFARHGARLVLVDIDEHGLKRVEAELKAIYSGTEIETVVASITDEEAVEQACAQAEKRFGRIDILLNNAGIGVNKPALEMTGSEWRRAVDIDLSGVFYFSQAAARRMVKQQSGVIINTASIWGVSSSPRRVAYCSAKAGVVSMTKCLAVEWAPYGIRVNAVCPGYTGTALIEELINAGKINEQALAERTPLKRLAAPEEMAEVGLYLASDAAAFVTGIALVSDGGWTANGF
jgi:NAD(P)-dependent dehydrogenase (short-subunit alcohol dehydrogenase family)